MGDAFLLGLIVLLSIIAVFGAKEAKWKHLNLLIIIYGSRSRNPIPDRRGCRQHGLGRPCRS